MDLDQQRPSGDARAPETAPPAPVPGRVQGVPATAAPRAGTPGVPGRGGELVGGDATAPGIPAPGATMFVDDDGLGWIALNSGGFECIQTPYGRTGELHAQVTRDADPARYQRLAGFTAATAPPPEFHVVKKGETPRMIAEQHGIATEALLDANRDKVKEFWNAEKQKFVKGFTEGDRLVIPRPLPPGVTPSWSEWAIEIARQWGNELVRTVTGIVDGIIRRGRDLVDGAIDWWNDEPTDDKPAPGDGGEARRLPEERITHWVDLAATCSSSKSHKASKPEKVNEINAWLRELAADLAATDDPIQRTTLVACQFQFETTKRGTDYNFGSDRDYDLDTTFDCSEAIQWMMQSAGLGDIFGESTAAIATLYIGDIVQSIFGARFRATPRTGDIMMWYGHVGVVAQVRPDAGVFYASHMSTSGSYFNAFDLGDPNKSGPGLIPATEFGKGFRGFWSPTSATLPAPIGTATVGTRYKGWKYSMPEANDNTRLGSEYPAGQRLVLLKRTGDFYLAHREDTRGAAWMTARSLSVDPAPAP